jgi:hypothetical protein
MNIKYIGMDASRFGDRYCFWIPITPEFVHRFEGT